MQTIRRRAGWLVPAIALMLALGVSACYEDYNLGYEDYDTALTVYDKTADFSSYRYFIMPDTIVHIYDTTQTDPLRDMRKYDDEVLGLVASNFAARGYERLASVSEITARGIDPNQVLGVMIGQFAIQYSGYYYDYWWGYWGGWWGWYYPYYPPTYVGEYEYTTGTYAIEAIDYGRTVAGQRVVGRWLGTITGLAGDVSSSVQQRISTNINQLFLQSPYLYAGQ